MRQKEDKKLRDFEIRQWFYTLRDLYISKGMSINDASAQAYDDVGIRFYLRKTAIRKAKNTPCPKNPNLMFEVKSIAIRLRELAETLEKNINEQR